MVDTAPPNRRMVPLWQQVVAIAIGIAATRIGDWLFRLDPENSWQFYQYRLSVSLFWWWLGALLVGWFAGLLGARDPLARLAGFLRPLARPAACFGTCALMGLAAAAGFGWHTRHLPPLYHDEYAYLFQAQTVLAGRLCFPTEGWVPFFAQIHVLDDPVVVSRYFPGTALWLVPFVVLGQPYLSHWVLNGLVAGFAALVGRQFSVGTGYLAGLLVAAAPGMAVLSNLLLSPHPTMFFVVVFYWAFLQSYERRSLFWPALAGTAIGLAFITRPLTAAGLGFPFALYALWRRFRFPPAGYDRRLAAMIVPFFIWVALLGAYHWRTVGSPLRSPYALYIATVTPSHVYGFYNVERGAERRGPTTLEPYDVWAENLVPSDVPRLVAFRWWRLACWTLAFVPAAVLVSLALLQCPHRDDRTLLLLLSIIGLAAAYAPYWFTGLLGCSYVIESLPALAVVASLGARRAAAAWRLRGWPVVGYAWIALPLAMACCNLWLVIPGVVDPRGQLVYPRREAQERRRLEEQASRFGPILVLVDADPKDAIHSTLVYNRPTLDGPIIRAWFRQPDIEALIARYPDRAVWLYQYRGMGQPGGWRRLRGPLVDR